MPDASAAVLAAVEACYRGHFGGEPARASVSFLGVEPIEILRFAAGDGYAYLSLGMSRRPMTAADAIITADAVVAADAMVTAGAAADAPRAELMVTTLGAADGAWRQLAVLAAAPAVQSTVYRVGDRVELDEPLLTGSRCFGGVLLAGDVPAARPTGLQPVEVLRLVPATRAELAWARVHGSGALVDLWRDQRTPTGDLMRGSAALG